MAATHIVDCIVGVLDMYTHAQILWAWVYMYVYKNCTSSNLARLCLIQRQSSHYFRCPVWKTKSWWKSKPTRKLKHTNSIVEYFEYFCQISSKSLLIISSYPIPFQSWRVFWDTV